MIFERALVLLALITSGCAFHPTLVRRLDPSGAPICACAFSADGKIIAVARPRGDIRVFDFATGKLIARADAFSPNSRMKMSGLAFSPDGRHLAYGGTNRNVRIWDFREGRVVSCSGHSWPIIDITFSRDGKRLVTASDAIIVHRNLGSKPPLTPPDFSIHPADVITFDTTTGEVVSRQQFKNLAMISLSRDGELLAGIYMDDAELRKPIIQRHNRTHVLEVRSARLLWEIASSGYAMFFSPGNKYVVIGDQVYLKSTGQSVKNLQGASAAAFIDDDHLLAFQHGIGLWWELFARTGWCEAVYLPLPWGNPRVTAKYSYPAEEESSEPYQGPFEFAQPVNFSPDRNFVIDWKTRVWRVPK